MTLQSTPPPAGIKAAIGRAPPASNVCTRCVPSIAEHPLRDMVDAGLFVTLNSDDPPMFVTSLSNE